MHRFRRSFTLVIMLAMIALAGCGPAADNARDTVGGATATFKIGIVVPLTGPAAEAGIAIKQGAELAAAEINAQGGVEAGGKKYRLELLFEDSMSKPEVGVSVAEKLLGRDRVNVLVGEAFHSSVTMAIMELAPKYPEIPFVSWEPVSSAIAEKIRKEPRKYANFWKGDYNSEAYGRTVFSTVKYLISANQFTPKSKTVAFVVEDTDYGRSNASSADQLFSHDDWKTVAIETVPLGHTDFYPQLNKLKSLKPDVVVTVFTSLASGVAFVKQYQETGLTALHMAVYYPVRPEFIEQAGKAAEGLLWTPLMFDPSNLKHQSAMANAIQERYGVKATSDHAYGYDGIYIIADAIKRAASMDGRKINEALSKTDYQGILGRYVFNPEDHTVKDGAEFLPVPTAQIQREKNVIIWPETVATANYQRQPWLR